MDEIEQRLVIKLHWKEGTEAHESQQRLTAVYDESSYAPSTICEGMRSLMFGITEMNDFHRSGSPPIGHTDDDIRFRLRIFPFDTVRTLAETFSVSSTAILQNFRNSLGLKHDHLRWAPSELTYHLKEKRAVMYRESLELLNMEETFGFARVVTGDESWLHLKFSHTHI
jgi:hypothetical protein